MPPLAVLSRTMILSLACAAAAGCSQTATGSIVCPPLKTYGEAFNRGLADEVEEIARSQLYPLARQALRDYATLRDQVRACEPPRQ